MPTPCSAIADLDVLTRPPGCRGAGGRPAPPVRPCRRRRALFRRRLEQGRRREDRGAERGARKVPIVVGGTGLYLMALTDGLSEIPTDRRQLPRPRPAPRSRRDPAAAWTPARRRTIPHAHDRIDPMTASAWPARSKCCWRPASRSPAFTARPRPCLPPGGWVGVALTPPREALYERINHARRRDDARGALDEARRLWERKLDAALPVMRAHGMPGFCRPFRRPRLARRRHRALQARHPPLRQAPDDLDRPPVHPLAPRPLGGAGRLRTRVISDIWAEA